MVRFLTIISLILIGAYLTSAAPAVSSNNKVSASKKSHVASESKHAAGTGAARSLKRGKRDVLATLNDEEEKALIDELSELSDNELRILSAYVAGGVTPEVITEDDELDGDEILFVPDSPTEEIYEIVEVPDELIEEPIVLPRDRRALLEELDELNDAPEGAEIEEIPAPVIIEQVIPIEEDLEDDDFQVENPIIIPEPVMEKLVEEEIEDMELESRIREMANILNERVSRDQAQY